MNMFVLSFLAKCGFSYFAYNAYEYYRLNKIKMEVETSGQIDLSYEVFDKEKLSLYTNKTFLIAGTNKNRIDISKQTEIFNGKRLEITRKANYNIELLYPSSSEININVLTKNRLIPYYDCGNLKAEEITITKRINDLSIIEKLHYFKNLVVTWQQKEKRIFLIDKGISENQRVLALGKISFNSNSIVIKPKVIICSGLVEFEEMVEYLRDSRSRKMFQISIILGVIACLDLFSRVYKKDK